MVTIAQSKAAEKLAADRAKAREQASAQSAPAPAPAQESTVNRALYNAAIEQAANMKAERDAFKEQCEKLARDLAAHQDIREEVAALKALRADVGRLILELSAPVADAPLAPAAPAGNGKVTHLPDADAQGSKPKGDKAPKPGYSCKARDNFGNGHNCEQCGAENVCTAKSPGFVVGIGANFAEQKVNRAFYCAKHLPAQYPVNG